MKIDNIVPCVCIKYKPKSSVSTYYGLPILRVCAVTYKGKPNNLFQAVCPNCGCTTLHQYKSAYLALLAWNNHIQTQWKSTNPVTGKRYYNYDNLPSLADGDGWSWNEPQKSINKELAEWGNL